MNQKIGLYRSCKNSLFPPKAEPQHGPLYHMMVEQDSRRGILRHTFPFVLSLLLWWHFWVTSDTGNYFFYIVLGWAILWAVGEIVSYRRMRRLIRSGALRDFVPPGTRMEQTADDLQEGLGALSASWVGLYIMMVLLPIAYTHFTSISFDYSFFVDLVFLPFIFVAANAHERARKETPGRPSLGLYLAVRRTVGRGVRRRWYRPVFHNFIALPLVCCLLISTGVNPLYLLGIIPAWTFAVVMIERVRKSPRFFPQDPPPTGEREQFLELLEEAIVGSDAEVTKPGSIEGAT